MPSDHGGMTPEQYEMLFGTPPPQADAPSSAPVPPPPPRQERETDRFTLAAHEGANAGPALISVSPPPLQPSTGRSSRQWWKKKRFMLPAGALLLIAAISSITGNGNGNSPESVSSADSAEIDDQVAVESSSTTASETTTSESAELVGSATVETVGAAASAVTSSRLAVVIDALATATVVESLVADVPYDRESYTAGGWGDSDDDCISDRHEVLIEESLVQVDMSGDGCRVETGSWLDRYDGATHTSEDAVTIDHFVPLAAAHRAGAWAWDEESKRAFAADITFPAALAVVGGDTNQAKADNEPDRWRPPEVAWCLYAIDWVSVKTRWSLNYSVSEKAALEEMLETCQPVNAPTDDLPLIPLAKPATSTTTSAAPTTTTTTEAAPAGEADVFVASCNARAEIVVLRNRGGTEIRLSGWVLHDDGRNHETGLGSISLGPDKEITMLSGQDTEHIPGAFRWTGRNVWNNDGDTASLLSNGNLISSARCK